jgi:hypothetical protein
MLKNNPFEPVVSKKRNPFEPINGPISSAVSAPAVTPIKSTPAPIVTPVAAPKSLTVAQQYGLPESTLSQGKAAAPEKQSIWNKVARAVLPDKVEDFFGMNKTPIQKQIETQGNAQLEYDATRGRGLVGNLKESYARGNEAAKIDTDMYSAMMSNDPNKYNEVSQRKQILQAKQTNDPIKSKNLGTKTVTTVAGMAPAMLTGNVQGKVLGAGLGAAALIAGQLGPQVGLPEELVTVPTAYKAGEMLGGMQYWYRQGAGSMYGVMRDEGIDHDTSKWLGSAAGVPYAAIEFSQVDKIVPGLNKLAKQEIASLTKRSVASMVQKYGKNWASEVGEEGMQEFITGMTTEMGKWMDEKVEGIPVAEALWKVSKQSVQTMIDSALPMLLMTAPNVIAEGAGAYTKKAPVNNQVNTQTNIAPDPQGPAGPSSGGQLTREEKDVSQTQPDTYGTVKEWGTQNQYVRDNPYRSQLEEMKTTGIYDENIVKEASRWEMGQVLQDKPAYLGSGALSSEEITAFAKKNNLWFRTKKGIPVIAKDIDSLNKVLNALDSGDQRELGLALGYIDTVPLDSSKQQLAPFSQQLDPSKSIGEIQEEYLATKPGQKNINTYFDQMVENGTMFPESATILKTIFETTNDDFLKFLNLSSVPTFGPQKKATLGRSTFHLLPRKKYGRRIVDESRLAEHKLQLLEGLDSNGKDSVGTFVHEVAHVSWWAILTKEERAIVTKVYKELGKGGARQLFEGSLNKNPDYHSDDVEEFWAQSCSEYVQENKIPAKEMEPLLKKVGRLFFEGLKKLVNRGNVDAINKMKPLFEKILKGDRSTPLSEFADKEPTSFRQDLQEMFNRLAPEASRIQSGSEQKSIFSAPVTKEAPAEEITPPAEETAITTADGILKKGKEGLPPDIGSTIEPLEAVIEGQKHTPLKERIGFIDYLRTPWRVFDKMGIRPAYQRLLKAYEAYVKELPINIDKITAWSKRVSAEGNVKIFKFLDGEEVTLTAEESQVAKEIRAWLGQWADRLGMEPGARITDYITHIFPADSKGEFPEEIASIIKDKIPGSVYDPFLLQRQGAKGYIQDTWKALDAYTKRATRKVNMDPALAELKEASAHLTDDSQITYLTKYTSALNMRPSSLDTKLDNDIKRFAGYLFGTRPTASITRFLRMMIARAKIGGSITSFAKNLTQGVNTFADLGTWYTLRGYIDLAKFRGKELKENGVLVAPFIEDRTYSAVKKMAEKFDNVLFLNMNASELVNRGAAYYGAKAKFAAGRTTDKEFRLAFGKEKPAGYTPTMEDAVAYGKFVAAKTQFLFGPLDTPLAFNSDIAKMAFQFQTFGVKQSEFIIQMLGEKEWKKFIRYVVSSTLLFTLVGRAFGMKWDDAFFPLRWGWPPAIQFFIDLYAKGITGEDKYGNKIKKLPALTKTLFTNVVPGGAQMERTFEGLSTVDAGKETTNSGKFKYKVSPTAENYITGTLFGKYNLPESKKYYKKQDDKKRGVKTKSGGNPFEPI